MALLVPECVDEAVGNIAKPLSERIGGALADVFDIAIGSKIQFVAEKKRIEYTHKLQVFSKQIETEQNKIPVGDRQEPNVEGIGETLEQLKWKILGDNETIKEMIAKLIAAYSDKEKANIIHPKFVEIIRQLSEEEAVFLQYFKEGRFISIFELYLKTGKNDIKQYEETAYIGKSSIINTFKTNTLKTLGLIDSDYNNYMKDKGFIDYCESIKNGFDSTSNLPDNNIRHEVKKGMCRTTQFGIDFINICCK
jgi:hypothetical protein